MKKENKTQELERLRQLEKKVETLVKARENHSAISGPFIDATCDIHDFFYTSRGLENPMVKRGKIKQK
jgi:predicted RNA-binding protein with EMAP domain